MNNQVINNPSERWKDCETLLADVQSVVSKDLKPIVNKIDQGLYPLDVMGKLARAGAFAAHLDKNGQRYKTALAANTTISATCGATGFMTWAHNVCGLYMEQSGNPALLERLKQHEMGLSFGGTGLSNPMKALTGIEAMALKAKKVPGGYIVNGTLPWVSHIGKNQYCGTIAAVEAADGSVSHEIMFLLDLDERITLKECPTFSGMEGTGTYSIPVKDYFVSEDQLIADPARPFVMKIRGAFILLQVGIAAGIIQGAIDSCREVESSLGHVNQFLDDRPMELQGEFDELAKRAFVLAEDPFNGSNDFLLDVLDVRAQGAELSLKATQSALMHQGARGYLMSSAPQRRIREAHFVAIVTPAIKHLRWEMNKLMKEKVAA